MANLKKVTLAIKQIKARKGKHYESWKKGILKSMEKGTHKNIALWRRYERKMEAILK